MKKRLVALTLTCALAATALAGCGGQLAGTVQLPVTLQQQPRLPQQQPRLPQQKVLYII